MIMNLTGSQQIFTYDKKAERKSGAMTMLIFSACLYVTTMILAIADLVLFLGTYLLSDMASVSIADGAVMDQSEIFVFFIGVTFVFGIILMVIFGIPALCQLLYAYALLPDGRLIKMKWKFRRVRHAQASILARKIAEHTEISRDSARDAIRGLYAFLDGLDTMHNPLAIAAHLDGSAINKNIISMPLDNVAVLKKTKKKLVIMADTLIKNKPKRKKIAIYCIYYDMDTLCRLCEGGRSVVDL